MDQATAEKFIQEKDSLYVTPQNIFVQNPFHYKPFTRNNMTNMERR